jgi:GDP-4-dehydro-6-deoxy-D-mannose reductase
MKKVLIIGAAGFVGNYLMDHLLDEGRWSVSVTKMMNETVNKGNVTVYDLDILDINEVVKLFQTIRPDHIIHLAAQSSVALSWKNPGLTIDVNIKGSANALEAARKLDYKPRILLIGSGEEYGHIQPDELPVKEDSRLRPGNIYAATKAAQNMIGKIYADAYNLDIICVRAFNHIGPAQLPVFVVADFCKQVSEIEKGVKEPFIKVGNLSAKRDFTDVRDVVKAYSLLIEKGLAGETYNVGSGHAVSIEAILNLILSMSKADIKVLTDEKKLRPVDVPVIEADISKIKRDTGWAPEIKLEDTIADTLNYWRSLNKEYQ